MSDDLVKRLRAGTGGGKLWMDLHTESADRIEELEAKLQDMSLDCHAALGQAGEAYQAQLAAESKLAKAVEALAINPWSIGYVEWKKHVNDTLAELESKP
jgi:hypothetical protein